MAASIAQNPSALAASGTNRQLSSPSARSLHAAREQPAYPCTHRTTCHSYHTPDANSLDRSDVLSNRRLLKPVQLGLTQQRSQVFKKSHSMWESNERANGKLSIWLKVVKLVQFSDAFIAVTDSGCLTFAAIFKGGLLAGMKLAFMVHSLQHITSPLQIKSSQGEPDCRVFPAFPWILRTAHQLQLLMACGKLFPFQRVEQKKLHWL